MNGCTCRTVTSPLNFGDFTFDGTLSGQMICGTFDFTSPTGGAGRASMTKQSATEPATWGNVKALYRDSGD